MRSNQTRWVPAFGILFAATLVGWSGPASAQPAVEPTSAAVIDAAGYPSLQAALDALPASGGLVRLPPGEFRLTQPLVLSRGNTRLAGAGPATVLVNASSDGQPTLVVRPPDLAEHPKTMLWRVQLSDFRIQGDPEAIDGKSTEPTSGDGLLAENVNEIYLHGLSVDHHGGCGVRLHNCYEDPRIADCIFTYNRDAGVILEGCHDIVVSANHFEENQDALRCVDSFNLTMTGNNLDDHTRDGVVIENTYGSIVSANMIEECQGRAIVLDRDCYGITVAANVLADDFGGGVALLDAWGCTVSANTFTIDRVFGLFIGPKSGRIAVTGNNFSDSYIGDGTRRVGEPNQATGIVLEGTRDIAISGNVFSGLSGPAVRADAGCQRLLIATNVVAEPQAEESASGDTIEGGKAEGSITEMNLSP